MHTITWISSNGIESLSSPKLSSIYRAYVALVREGKTVRLWKGKELVM